MNFVDRDSVVRTIWGNGDMALLVFAGSAAEFALNRAVDWLFFTGKLPRVPIGRLFSTAAYAQDIVFADAATASRALDRIRAAHEAVEHRRGQTIPDWAHRDVLYMLIDYSERAHEMFSRPLTAAEQHELYDVFYRVVPASESPTSHARTPTGKRIAIVTSTAICTTATAPRSCTRSTAITSAPGVTSSSCGSSRSSHPSTCGTCSG